MSIFVRICRGHNEPGLDIDDSGGKLPTISLILKDDGTAAVNAIALDQGAVGTLRRLTDHIYLTELHQENLDVDLLAISAPWTESVSWLQHLRSERRTFVLSTCGFLGQTWYDGPLAHINARHEVASYVPSGGYGALRIPRAADPSVQGLTLSDIDTAEGAFNNGIDERAHRILLAAVRAKLYAAGPSLTFALDDFGLRNAVELTLVRQALPRCTIAITAPKPLPPQWRRLLQNINVRLSNERQSTRAGALALPLPNLVPEAYVAGIAGSINSPSAVLPQSMVKA
ncbi:MAG: hypothetical protein FJ146_17575 [Deltaproteobacteria bacterium]|nr:hypothetical protein [Deltaproteobacteria bacterium]